MTSIKPPEYLHQPPDWSRLFRLCFIVLTLLMVVALVPVYRLGQRPARPLKPVKAPSALPGSGVTVEPAEGARQSAANRSVLPPQILSGVQDLYPLQRVPGTSAYITVVESDLLAAVCNYLHMMDDKDLSAAALKAFSYMDFEERPDRLRGRALHVRGRLLRLQPLDLPKSAGCVVERVYEGTVLDSDRNHYGFYVMERPIGFKPQEERVELVGVFLKNVQFPTRGGKCFAAPLLIGKRLDRIAVGAVGSSARPPGKWTIGALLAAFVILSVLLVRWREKRRSRRFWAARETAQSREGGAGPEA